MRNNVFWRIMPLFLLMTFMSSGCSKDEEVNPVEEVDGIVMDRNGTLVVVSEVKEYPDSVKVWGLRKKIPCRPVKKEKIPKWLFDELLETNAKYDNTSLILGDWIDNSGQMCYMYRITLSDPFSYMYTYGDFGERYNLTYENWPSFFSSTTNWRCIYMTTVKPLNK